MITDLLDKNIIKVLALFSISPGSKVSRKEIKEKTKMNNVPLDNSINKLLKSELLIRAKNIYGLNLNSKNIQLFNSIKELHKELNSLPLEVFFSIIEVSDKLSSVKSVKNVFLFGSYAKLIYTEKSDIDIAIILKDKNRGTKKISKILSEIKRRGKEEIEVHFFSEEDMKHKEDSLIRDIQKNNRRIL